MGQGRGEKLLWANMEEHQEGEAARCNKNFKKNAFIAISMYAVDGEEQRTAQKNLKLQMNLQSIDKSTTAKASNTAGGCLVEL